MKVGDLVSYNAAGMLNKTLGLVVDFRPLSYSTEKMVLIQWHIVGKYMPRKEIVPRDPVAFYDWHGRIKSGNFVWHRAGDWFRVVND